MRTLSDSMMTWERGAREPYWSGHDRPDTSRRISAPQSNAREGCIAVDYDGIGMEVPPPE